MKRLVAVATVLVILLYSCAAVSTVAPSPGFVANPCRSAKVFPVAIKPGFSEDELALILHGLGVWTVGTGGRLNFVMSDDSGLLIRQFDNQKQLEALDSGDATVLGFYDPSLNIIEMATQRIHTHQMFEIVFIHELGHALGLEHDTRHQQTYMHARIDNIPRDLKRYIALPLPDQEAYWEHDDCGATIVTVTQRPAWTFE